MTRRIFRFAFACVPCRPASLREFLEKEQRQQRIEARLKVLRAAGSIQKLDAGPV